MDDLIGRYSTREASLRRRLSMEAFDALPASHVMYGLMELDVSVPLAWVEARRAAGERVTLTALMMHAIAQTLAEYPALNSMRQGSRIVTFEDVDLNVPVERATSSGPFPHMAVIRRAQHKSPVQIYAEIERARHATELPDDAWALRLTRLLLWLPRVLRRFLIRRLSMNVMFVKRRMGTTLITSVGKLGTAPSFVLPMAGGPRAAVFALGPVARRAVPVGDGIEARPVLGVTLMLNHELVDGAPAAAFAARLQQRVEQALDLA